MTPPDVGGLTYNGVRLRRVDGLRPWLRLRFARVYLQCIAVTRLSMARTLEMTPFVKKLLVLLPCDSKNEIFASTCPASSRKPKVNVQPSAFESFILGYKIKNTLD